jgi:hypothetical protein
MSPSPTAITVCTVSSIGSTGASWAVSDRSATITESCASLAMNAI